MTVVFVTCAVILTVAVALVLRRVEMPTYESAVIAQIEQETGRRGVGSLEKLLRTGDVWTVHPDGSIS